MFSLISYGLTSCKQGFGTNLVARKCGNAAKMRETSDGSLGFSPSSSSSSTPSAIVDELDLLLTGGVCSEDRDPRP